MLVRLTDGEKAGTVVEVEDQVGEAWLVSGKAVPAELSVETEGETEEAADSDVAETPEKPRTTTKRRTPERPETR